MRQVRRQSKSISSAVALLIAIAITTYSPPSSSSFTQAATLRKQECSFECQYNVEGNIGGLSTVRECCEKHTPNEGGRCSVNENGNVCKCSVDKACYVDTRCQYGGDWPNNCIKKTGQSPHKKECSIDCQYNAEVNTGELQTVRECCDQHTPRGGGRCSVNEKGNVCQCSVDKACYVDTRCQYGGDWPDKCIYQQPQTSSSTTTTTTTTTIPPPTKANKMRFKSFIGSKFFRDKRSNEASGLALAPDKSHLIVVSDNGKIFFLNLIDYNSGHCVWENDRMFNYNTDFEGVTIVPAEWSQNNMIAYLVHEGGDDDRPYLYKVQYTFNPNLGNCSVQLVESHSLRGALPCLPDSNGIESLTWKVGTSNPAVFYVGIQDTGRIYEITSNGESNGDVCFESGIGRDDISGSYHDGKYIWSTFGDEGKLSVIDPARGGCTLAVIDIPRQWDTEGLVIDFENDLMYLAVDEQGGSDPSIVAVYDFIYNLDNKECISDIMPRRTCTGFRLCGR